MPIIKGVANVETINAAYEALDKKVQRSLMGKALRAGARIVRAAAKALVPELTGKLKSKIVVRTARARKKGRINITMGTGDKLFAGETFYAGFQEMGWKSGKRGSLKKRKQNPGEHFLAHAFEETSQAAVKTIETTLVESVQEAAKELAVRGEGK